VALAPLASAEASAVAGHKNRGWPRVRTHPEQSFALTLQENCPHSYYILAVINEAVFTKK